MGAMCAQEDLSAMFSRNLSLNNHQEQTPPYIEALDPPAYESIAHPISYSASQHYNHSAHVVKQPDVSFRSASEPTPTSQQTVEIILARHGVDISRLRPDQIQLFKNANTEQQMRLVELWNISPPDYGGHALAPSFITWQTTSFEQEEAMAKMRYDRLLLEQQQRQVEIQDSMTGRKPNEEIEPYMTSGYEQLARREYEASAEQPTKEVYSHFGTAVGGHAYNHATDPVYNIIPNSGPEWERRQQQAMENQYGAFQQGHCAGIQTGHDVDNDMDML